MDACGGKIQASFWGGYEERYVEWYAGVWMLEGASPTSEAFPLKLPLFRLLRMND